MSGSLIYAKRDFIIPAIINLSAKQNHIGIEGLYTNTHLPPQLSGLISHGLTVISANDKPILSPIVDSVDTDETNLFYTFNFKEPLYWHNGRKFRSSDLSITIPGATITYPSPNSLTITLKSQYSPLMSLLSQPLYYNQSLIGVGDYQVVKTTYQDGFIKTLEIVAIKNKQDRTTYHFYPNSTDLINAFKLGEVNQLTTSILGDSHQWRNVKINPSVSTRQYLAIFLNTSKLSSKTFRQSLAYATPKTSDKNQRCLGPISPISWAYNPQIKPYNYNPTRAKELMDKDEVKQINLMITDRQLLSTAEIIKKSWQDILGIQVNLSIENQKPDLINYEAILSYGTIPNDPDQYPFWHSTQTATNITHFNNSRIDKLLEEGRLNSNPVERKQIYQDFQRYLLEESPVIFLEFPTSYNISRVK